MLRSSIPPHVGFQKCLVCKVPPDPLSCNPCTCTFAIVDSLILEIPKVALEHGGVRCYGSVAGTMYKTYECEKEAQLERVCHVPRGGDSFRLTKQLLKWFPVLVPLTCNKMPGGACSIDRQYEYIFVPPQIQKRENESSEIFAVLPQDFPCPFFGLLGHIIIY